MNIYCADRRTETANLVFDETSTVISIWLKNNLNKRKRNSVWKQDFITFTTGPQLECSKSKFIK